MKELICDVFAGGGGASLGIFWATGSPPDVAINHDAGAIAMHQANHPGSKHFLEDVWKVSPAAVTKGRTVGLLWCSPDCFTAGTLILTGSGHKPIETVMAGEYVLTHKNRWRRVISTISKTAATVVLRGHGHWGLVTTPEHQLYSKRVTRRYPGAGRDGKRPGGGSGIREMVENPYWPKALDMVGKLWATPIRISPLPMPLDSGASFGSDFFYFLGRWVGDGSLNKGDVEICCGNSEFDALAKYFESKPMHNAAGEYIPFRVVDHDSSKLIVWGNTRLVEWLRANFGDSCESKHLPAWLLGAQVDWRRSFLNGYVDADGHVADGVISTNSVSRALSVGVRLLVASLGYVPAMYLSKGRPGQIEGRKFVGKDAYRVVWREELKAEQCFRDTLHLFSPVREVIQTEREQTVYCLEVEEDHSYTADGIVVHNCCHFSRAKGAKPVKKSIRSLAWVVVKWAAEVRPRIICLENVREFEMWGPLIQKISDGAPQVLEDGSPVLVPDPNRKGHSFRRWAGRLRGLGYEVQWRVLDAANFGAPTHRRRLFLIARCDGQKIVWPEPTHGDPKKLDDTPLFGRMKPWRTAAECIDWSIPCPSIFERKRPLADNTLRRIAMGINRYVLENQNPFIVQVNHGGEEFRGQDLGKPLSTVTGKHGYGVVVPHVTKFRGGSVGSGIDEPLPTITSGAGAKRPAGAAHAMGVVIAQLAHGKGPSGSTFNDGRASAPDCPLGTVHAGGNNHAVVAPLLSRLGQTNGNGKYVQGVDEAGTLVSKAEHLLVAPTLVQTGYGERDGQSPRCLDLQAPLGTVVAGGSKAALIAAFMAKHFGGVVGCSVDRPASTATTKDHQALVAANLIHLNHGEKQWNAADEPLRTLTTGNHAALVYSFLIRYFGTAIGQHCTEPLFTITGKDRFGLVTVVVNGELYVIVDIGMRMLMPRELARAQGFPNSYVLTGSKSNQVARIGNSVVPQMAQVIAAANYKASKGDGRKRKV